MRTYKTGEIISISFVDHINVDFLGYYCARTVPHAIVGRNQVEGTWDIPVLSFPNLLWIYNILRYRVKKDKKMFMHYKAKGTLQHNIQTVPVIIINSPLRSKTKKRYFHHSCVWFSILYTKNKYDPHRKSRCTKNRVPHMLNCLEGRLVLQKSSHINAQGRMCKDANSYTIYNSEESGTTYMFINTPWGALYGILGSS